MVKDRDIAIAKGQLVVPQYEFRFLRKDGGVEWVEVLATVLDYRGQAANMGNVADISERKLVERSGKS